MPKQPPIAMRAWIFCNRCGTKSKLTHSDANCCLWLGVTCTDLQIERWSKMDCCLTRWADVKTTINCDESVNIVWQAWHQTQTYTRRCELLPSLTRNNSHRIADRTLIEAWLPFSLIRRCQNNHQSWWEHEYCVMGVAPKTNLIAQMRIIAVFEQE